jgi:hypothetical protein
MILYARVIIAFCVSALLQNCYLRASRSHIVEHASHEPQQTHDQQCHRAAMTRGKGAIQLRAHWEKRIFRRG